MSATIYGHKMAYLSKNLIRSHFSCNLFVITANLQIIWGNTIYVKLNISKYFELYRSLGKKLPFSVLKVRLKIII